MSRPLVVAHRGASAAAPANTLAAFRAGIEAGADGVEFDVRLTLDGVPVVIEEAAVEAASPTRAPGLAHPGGCRNAHTHRAVAARDLALHEPRSPTGQVAVVRGLHGRGDSRVHHFG